jgi:BirA family biotin operon repressor/biotin-[acetyl-CoA-carboxylase] ligase
MFNVTKLRGAVLGDLWTSLDVVESTGSTNADLLDRARAEPASPEGQVLIAEAQTAGRGRLGRSWQSVPEDSLTFSVLLRPASVPAERRGWLTLLAGLAVASAVRDVSKFEAGLKWPNDVLIGDRKLAGILAEQTPDAAVVVIGIGVNVTTPDTALVSLPSSPAAAPATSLLVEGARVSREDVLIGILTHLESWYIAFCGDPDPVGTGLLAAYREHSATLGRAVRAELPGGQVVSGIAADLDPSGRLLISEKPDNPLVPISAGDVIHVRSDQV